MNKEIFEFKFSLFGKRDHMFNSKKMGVVIEKEPRVVCVYGTDETNRNILCAIPLSNPKYLHQLVYKIAFTTNDTAIITVGEDICVYIDFQAHKCSTNKDLPCYGSDDWGHDVGIEWSESYLL